MDLFRFCETYLLYIKLFVGNLMPISPFLGSWRIKRTQSSSEVRVMCVHRVCVCVCFEQFLKDFLEEFLDDFLYENLNVLTENLRFYL